MPSTKTTVKNTKRASGAKKQVVQTSKTYTNMFLAYGAFWRRGFSEWAGTSSRSEYWWTYLVNCLLIFAWGFLGCMVAAMEYVLAGDFGVMTGMMLVIPIIYCFAAVVPAISMRVRRLHDAGLSAWWMMLYILCGVPLLSIMVSVVMFIFSVLPTCNHDNPYHKFNRK